MRTGNDGIGKAKHHVRPATEATQSFAVVVKIADSIVLRNYF